MKLITIPTRDGMGDGHFDHCAYYTIVTLEEQNQNITRHHHDRDHHEEKPVDYTAYGDVDITENAFGNVTAN